LDFTNDLASLAASAGLLLAYHAWLRWRLRQDPGYSVHAVNALVRAAWVEEITRRRDGILAVQTLRNSLMAAIFLASTAVLLIIGVLTLSEQGDKLRTAWQALDVFGAASTRLWLSKMILLLIDLLVAFFSFTMAIRLFHHVGYMINVPPLEQPVAMNAKHVIAHLNRAGKFYSIGMRAYYFTAPLLAWLFGPHLMFGATVALVITLYHLDRTPRLTDSDS
jgi:uncharacterized membrane protein